MGSLKITICSIKIKYVFLLNLSIVYFFNRNATGVNYCFMFDISNAKQIYDIYYL